MITRARWDHIASLAHEERADRIEHDYLDPQMREGRIIPHRDHDEVAMVRLADEPQGVIDALVRRAKAAGWRAHRDPDGWFFVKVTK